MRLVCASGPLAPSQGPCSPNALSRMELATCSDTKQVGDCDAKQVVTFSRMQGDQAAPPGHKGAQGEHTRCEEAKTGINSVRRTFEEAQ
jgi:hypothetical protein